MSFGASATRPAGGFAQDEFEQILLDAGDGPEFWTGGRQRSHRDSSRRPSSAHLCLDGPGAGARLRARERARMGALRRHLPAAAHPRRHRHHRQRNAGPRIGRSTLRRALRIDRARRRAALPAALLSRPRLADGLAAHHSCPAPRGSLSPHAAPEAAGGFDRSEFRASARAGAGGRDA